MATRQEIQVGHDLIHFTNRINFSLFAIAQQLQGIIKVKVSIDFETSRDPTPQELRTIATDGLKNVNGKYSAWIDAFLSAAPANLPDNGLDYFNISRSVIDNDVSHDKSAHLNIINRVGGANTMQALKVLGENTESNFSFSLDSNFLTVPATVRIPEAERITNICNDCLDTASYELTNIHPYTGASTSLTVDEIKKKVPDRFRVVELRAGDVPYGDMSDMLTVATQARVDLEKSNSYQDLTDIAIFINSNVTKLPLVRRSWGL